MLHYLFRRNKDYSRFNIIKHLLKDVTCKNDIFILLPFSKNQFFKHFFKRNRIVNDFFISNYDTYVYDREKISKYNPRAWWKYLQDWVNFRFSKFLLCDTQAHFDYWQKLFGTFKGEHFVLPVLADTSLYYPEKDPRIDEPKRILFYGSFIPLHGINIILKAFALLEKEQIAFQAQVVGKGQMFSAMKVLHENLHLCNVKMDGLFMNEQALVDEIRKADIVLGIFGHSQKAFSVIPNKAYQALACQKALITMTTPTMYEFFNDHEILMCPNTPEALAEAMKKLINDTALLQQYQTNGYQAFNTLYEQTQKRFEHFIHTIDQSLG